MNDTEVQSGFSEWYAARESTLAVVGFLFFVLVASLLGFTCLFTIGYGWWSECGKGYEKALAKKEQLVQWSSIQKDTEQIPPPYHML